LRERLNPQEEKERIFEDVNAIQFFPDDHLAHVYVKGTKNVIENVLEVKWLPYRHVWEPIEKLPVVLFRADTLSTTVAFDPYVKVRYGVISMELTILWGPVA